jgi:hypothetical protein
MESNIEVDPILIGQPFRTPIRAVVVGCGGTGARLIQPLTQVLRRGDSLALVDGDHVEDRNLMRQNFRQRDVGLNKAEVLARRYRKDGVEVQSYSAMLTEENFRAIMTPPDRERNTGVVIFGCVDSAGARRVINNSYGNIQCLWIDGGNEMRGGQVLLSARGWPFQVKAMKLNTSGSGDKVMGQHTGQWHLSGMKAMPQLLKTRPEEAEEHSCRERIDLQTVAVNQLSASCMLNIFTNVLNGVPMSNCGAFFSTLNTMTPIKVGEVKWPTTELIPEQTYVLKD